MVISPSEEIRKYIEKNLDSGNSSSETDNLSLLRFFNQSLYNRSFQPDISGYVFISLIPPDLSGYSSSVQDFMVGTVKNFLFLAIDFATPETSIGTTDFTSGSSIVLPYAINKKSGGQMSINYIENINLNIYQYHLNWINYINDVLYGEVSPDEDKYITGAGGRFEDVGSLDYAAAAYVVKYDPRVRKLSYIAKATGLIPLNIPNKEVIGNRETLQLTILPMSYICADYIQLVFDENGNPLHVNQNNDWLFDDFKKNVISIYK